MAHARRPALASNECAGFERVVRPAVAGVAARMPHANDHRVNIAHA